MEWDIYSIIGIIGLIIFLLTAIRNIWKKDEMSKSEINNLAKYKGWKKGICIIMIIVLILLIVLPNILEKCFNIQSLEYPISHITTAYGFLIIAVGSIIIYSFSVKVTKKL